MFLSPSMVLYLTSEHVPWFWPLRCLSLIHDQINMKGLDGIQGPVYVGTGCVFRRQALYGYEPPKRAKRPKMVSCDCCPCFGRRKTLENYTKHGVNGDAANVEGFL